MDRTYLEAPVVKTLVEALGLMPYTGTADSICHEKQTCPSFGTVSGSFTPVGKLLCGGEGLWAWANGVATPLRIATTKEVEEKEHEVFVPIDAAGIDPDLFPAGVGGHDISAAVARTSVEHIARVVWVFFSAILATLQRHAAFAPIIPTAQRGRAGGSTRAEVAIVYDLYNGTITQNGQLPLAASLGHFVPTAAPTTAAAIAAANLQARPPMPPRASLAFNTPTQTKSAMRYLYMTALEIASTLAAHFVVLRWLLGKHLRCSSDDFAFVVGKSFNAATNHTVPALAVYFEEDISPQPRPLLTITHQPSMLMQAGHVPRRADQRWSAYSDKQKVEYLSYLWPVAFARFLMGGVQTLLAPGCMVPFAPFGTAPEWYQLCSEGIVSGVFSSVAAKRFYTKLNTGRLYAQQGSDSTCRITGVEYVHAFAGLLEVFRLMTPASPPTLSSGRMATGTLTPLTALEAMDAPTGCGKVSGRKRKGRLEAEEYLCGPSGWRKHSGGLPRATATTATTKLPRQREGLESAGEDVDVCMVDSDVDMI